MNTSAKNYNSIDLMKFLMALVVISIHTEPLWNFNCLPLLYAVEALRNISVPFFFIATGFLLSKKEENGSADVLKRHMIKTLKLYVILSVVYLPLAIVYYVSEQKGFWFSVVHYIRGLVITGEHYNSWMLWYLLGGFYCLLVFVIFDRQKIDRSKSVLILFLAGLVFTCAISVLLNVDETQINAPLLKIKNIISVTIVDDRLFRPFVYIPMGMLIAKSKSRWLGGLGIVALVIGYTCTLISYVYGIEWRYILITTKSVWVILGSFGLFCVTALFSFKDSSVFKYLRTISSFMYFSHMWIWTCVYFVFYGEKTYGLVCFLVTTIISILIGSAVFFVEKRKSIRG